MRLPERTARGSFFRRSALGIVCLAAFLVLLVGMTLTGWHSFNSEQIEHGDPQLSLWVYLGQGNIWEALFENWESEFLDPSERVRRALRG